MDVALQIIGLGTVLYFIWKILVAGCEVADYPGKYDVIEGPEKRAKEEKVIDVGGYAFWDDPREDIYEAEERDVA